MSHEHPGFLVSRIRSTTDVPYAQYRAHLHLGLKASLHKTRWSKLHGTPFPAVAKRTNGRYVVLPKLEGEKALIQDPVEVRQLVLSREQFESAWSEEVLLFTKRANLRFSPSCGYTARASRSS